MLQAQAEIGSAGATKAAKRRKRFLAGEAQIPKGLKGDGHHHRGLLRGRARRHERRVCCRRGSHASSTTDPSAPTSSMPSRTTRKPHMPKAGKISLIDYRHRGAQGRLPGRGPACIRTPALLAVLARDPSTPPEIKLTAVKKRRCGQRHRPGGARPSVRRLDASGDAGALERATLFKTAEIERTPLKKARLIRTFLDEGAAPDSTGRRCRLADKPVACT